MSGVFTGQPNRFRESLGSKLLQSNQANARDGKAIVQFRPHPIWKQAGNDIRLDAEIQQNSTADQPHDGRQLHLRTLTQRFGGSHRQTSEQR